VSQEEAGGRENEVNQRRLGQKLFYLQFLLMGQRIGGVLQDKKVYLVPCFSPYSTSVSLLSSENLHFFMTVDAVKPEVPSNSGKHISL
jgi:hypothetical protein